MKRHVLLMMLIGWLLAACGTATGPAALPAGATPDTPTPTATVVLPTREPLPPTWTPFAQAQPTITPFPGPTRPPYTPPPTPTLPPVCLGFAADYERIGDTFAPGTAPTLYWTAIDVPAYRVVVTDPEGEAVLVRWVDGDVDTFTIPAETFGVDEESLSPGSAIVFGWEVTPVDDNRVRYCDPIGGELILVPGEG